MGWKTSQVNGLTISITLGPFLHTLGSPPLLNCIFTKNFQTAFDPNPLMGFMINKKCSSKYMSQYLENSCQPAPPSLIIINTSLNSHSLWLPHSLFKENQMVLIRHWYLAHCIAIGFLVPRAFQKYTTCMVCGDFLISITCASKILTFTKAT